MDKGKAVMGTGRRWAVDFSDQSTVPSSRDILDPPGFSRASPEQVLFFIFDYVLKSLGFSVVFLLELSCIATGSNSG